MRLKYAFRLSVMIFLTIFVVEKVRGDDISVEIFGAVPGYTDLNTCKANSKAFVRAFILLNSTRNYLLVPSGKSFCTHPVYVSNLTDLGFKIEGDILASKSIDDWPLDAQKKRYLNLFDFSNSSNLTFTGTGQIIGYGYDWWLGCYIGTHGLYKLKRPYLINIVDSQDLLIEGFTMWDSPSYNIYTTQTNNVEIRDMFILTNTTKQRELFLLFDNITEFSKYSIPLFPLNTDGIDPAGQNYYIHNVTIRNYDDAIAVKPSKLKTWGCSENMIIENMHVILGVGMSIGSVPPHINTNCIRNISFTNIQFKAPIKGVYVKTNSGNPNGTGIVNNINYTNLTMDYAIWYSVYIGPQQQKQPDGGGDGWWPPTQPLVSVDNITITNLVSRNALFFKYGAGVLRCNVSNPCKNLIFNNMTISGWAINNWCCEYIYGQCNGCTPYPYCIKPDQQISQLDHSTDVQKRLEYHPKKLELRPYEEIRSIIEKLEQESSILLQTQEQKYLQTLQKIEDFNSIF